MWRPGDTVIRREVRSDGWAWLAPVTVVLDAPDLLATYLAEGTPFVFRPGLDDHPWAGRGAWQGHGVLMLHRPREAHAVWVFWEGPERELACWYLNLQEPFRRTALGFDTQDLELDIVVDPDGSWRRKDEELLELRLREGRFTEAQLVEIRAEGARIEAELAAGRRWWDPRWARWEPDPAWPMPTPPRAQAPARPSRPAAGAA
jgi:hypothetical protein